MDNWTWNVTIERNGQKRTYPKMFGFSPAQVMSQAFNRYNYNKAIKPDSVKVTAYNVVTGEIVEN